VEPDLVVDHMEAWMPEQVAIYKLQGFADAIHGQIVECVPGLVRLRVGKPAPPPVKRAGLFNLLGLNQRPPEPPTAEIDIELRLRHRTEKRGNQLQLLLLMRPVGPRGTRVSRDYHARCGEIQRTLRSFLMCSAE
jgi:serine/threonine-protein kinase